MKDQSKKKQVLIQELASLRQKISEFEQTETERKQVEDTLREREKMLSSIIHSFSIPAFVIGKDRKVLHWNQALESLSKIPAAEVVGTNQHWRAFYAQERPCLADLLVDEVIDNIPQWYEGKYIKSSLVDGVYEATDFFPAIGENGRFLRFTAAAVRDFRGNLVGVVETLEDITDRKRVEEALRESEEFAKRVIESSKDCIKVLDLEGHLLSMSQGGQELLEIDDIMPYVNTSWVDFWKGKDREVALEAISKAVNGNMGLFRGYCKTAKGTPKWWEVIISPIKDNQGKIYRLLAVSRDITERKRMEDHLEERTAQLELANQELESFSYSISHDLRAPLRAIDGFSRMILKKHGDNFDKDTQDKFNVIRSNTHMMGQLIDDLLAFSRLGKKEPAISKLDMSSLIGDVWKELQVINPDRRINLKIHKVPPCMGDRILIKQVYINLLSNAIKFTRNREDALIEAGGHVDRNENIYYVKDNGIGFEMEYYDKLFGVFQRLHDAKDYEGTGVGLAIVQRIIRRHGGRVWAKAEVDKGACFYFALLNS